MSYDEQQLSCILVCRLCKLEPPDKASEGCPAKTMCTYGVLVQKMTYLELEIYTERSVKHFGFLYYKVTDQYSSQMPLSAVC